MTVRQKISLLITAAGFGSSLVFSCIILWEMIEQPFRIIDADLEATARRAVHMVLRREGNGAVDTSGLIGAERYWLKIYEPETGRLLYASPLVSVIDISDPPAGSGATVSLAVGRERIDLGQNRRNKLTVRVKTTAVSLDGKTFLVSAGRPMQQLDEELWDVFIGVASGLIFSVLLLVSASYFVAGLILQPVRDINDLARDITEKHLDRRIPDTGGRDEFSVLARTLNQVFDRLQHAFFRQKRFLADASHELKTPLTMMRLSVDEMRSAYEDDMSGPEEERLTRMTEQVLRMERLVKNLLDLSSLEIEAAAIKAPMDAAPVLGSLLADYRYLADTRDIHIAARLPASLPVAGDVEKLTRAFSNILDNAIKYNVDGGRVEVVAAMSGEHLTVTVSNTGPGVAEAEIPKVFQQFFRVEESRSTRYGGSGLGLAIVLRIVELHGGSVTFESRPERWTRVTIRLPVAANAVRT